MDDEWLPKKTCYFLIQTIVNAWWNCLSWYEISKCEQIVPSILISLPKYKGLLKPVTLQGEQGSLRQGYQRHWDHLSCYEKCLVILERLPIILIGNQKWKHKNLLAILPIAINIDSCWWAFNHTIIFIVSIRTKISNLYQLFQST